MIYFSGPGDLAKPATRTQAAGMAEKAGGKAQSAAGKVKDAAQKT